jgi:hypothetical protein
MGILWPRATWPQEAREKLGTRSTLWTLSCLATAVFPFLEVNKEESVPVMWVFFHCICLSHSTGNFLRTAGGLTLAGIGALQAYRIVQRPGTNEALKKLYVVQVRAKYS